MNRVAVVSLIILCLFSVSSMAGLIHVVKADGVTITINADGSITPSIAPIYTADNVTYTLIGNITAAPDSNGIVIERDNIVLDGAGHALQGATEGTGLMLSGVSNVTIKNTEITTCECGIAAGSSSNCSISANNVANISMWGIYLPYFSNSNVSGNNVTSNGNNSWGIYVVSSVNNTLSDNNVTNNTWGIRLYSSFNNALSDNNVTNNEYGIYLESSVNNTLSGNNVMANKGEGIVLETYSDNNTLSGNNIADNYDGTGFDSNSGNTLSGNNVTGNTYDGIDMDSSSSNTIYDNNFINNTYQVFTVDSANIWDNGSEGNYWSDYLTKYPNATQVDSSGVWNTPYVIDTNNTDRYPLTTPYGISESPTFPILPLFVAATVLAVIALLAVMVYKKKDMKTSQS